jgi:predicted metal-dependent phosphoesterase TrpH
MPAQTESMRVDLHIHSTASDGCWPPEELVARVRQTGIDLLAVADHDTVGSVLPVERLARGSGLGFIRAIEVSTTLDGHLFHLLAYGINLKDSALLEVLDDNWHKLTRVDDQSIAALIEAGYEISWEEYRAYENDPTRGGWKALNFMIDRGICRDVNDFYERLFVGDMALEYPSFIAPDEAVRIIHGAGGTVICAHPGHSTGGGSADLLEKLVDCGVEGLECYSPYHDEATIRHYLDFSRRRDLLVTAGSDCHGGFVGRPLGTPEAYVRDLRLGHLFEYVIR